MKEKKRRFLAGKAVAVSAVIFLAIFGLLATGCNNDSSPSLRSIVVIDEPLKLTYIIGESLNIDGIKVETEMSDGSSYIVAHEDLTFTIAEEFYADDKFIKVGTNIPVTVTYKGKDASFNVTVREAEVTPPSLVSIAVTPPAKRDYIVGESLITAGMVVTATYDDDSTGVITTGFTLSHTGAFTAANPSLTITVTYQNRTATFTVRVDPPAATLVSIAVNTEKAITDYFVGDTFSSDGIVVTATYSDETTEVITTGLTFSVEGVLDTANDALEVTVTYEGKTATFNIKVIAIVLEGIKITTYPTLRDYFVGDTSVDLTELVLTATYNNGPRIIPHDEFDDVVFNFSEAGDAVPVTIHFGGKEASFNVSVTVFVGTEQERTFAISVAQMTEKAVFDEDTIDSNIIIYAATGSKNSHVFTADGDADAISWYINGAKQATTESSITVNAASFEKIGLNVLTLEVEVDGKTYRQNVTFWVAL